MNQDAGKQPLRLCIVNPYGYELFDPASRASQVFGGAEVQLYYLATALAARPSFEVSMIVELPPSGVAAHCDGIRMYGVPPVSSRFARLRDRVPVPAVSYHAAMRRADADIYLQRGGAVLTGDVAAFCRTMRRRFAFMAAHDWDCDHTHRRGRQYLSGMSYLAGLRSADLVFAQSAHQRDLLRKHHGIRSVVQRTVYPEPTESTPDREHVLWIGRCLAWKRPLMFLDLAARRPDVPFVMVCPAVGDDPTLYDRVVARAAQLPNVDFRGFVPFLATEELFQRAVAYVNTSVAEGFPNTFVQAARTGTPILSLDVDPDGMLAGEDIGAQGDLGLLRDVLDELVAGGAAWRRQSANCRSYFRREHELGVQAARFEGALLRMRVRARSAAR